MGQYHKLVNLDKQEVVHPYALGLGAKQYEQTGCAGSIADAMYLLVMTSPARGGGDWEAYNGLSGRWVGDRVVVLGDYTTDSDVPNYENAGSIYTDSLTWRDISPEVATALGEIWDFKVESINGSEWLTRVAVK